MRTHVQDRKKAAPMVREYWNDGSPELRALYLRVAGQTFTFKYIMRPHTIDLDEIEAQMAPIDEEQFWDLTAMWFVRLMDLDEWWRDTSSERQRRMAT